ncbi:MAG: hypothetical protein WC986_14095 [Elusimicrobiota bacterium]|jgi:hypothetical protein
MSFTFLWNNFITPKNLVFLAGLLHFCQIPALFFAPTMLGWKEDLEKLRPINRMIFFVIGWAIVLTVIGLGIVVMTDPNALVSGQRLGTALSAFLGIFWTYRGTIQVAVYPKIWPGGFMGRASHYGLVALFTFLAGIYILAFLYSISLHH